ncbi:MAG: PilZ domain-containing protein [Pyrinomonadaceae bacterium]
MNRERSIEIDRRTDVRYVARIKIAWETVAGKQSGMISDISETGCFVLCSGTVEDGAKVNLYLPAKQKRIVTLRGEVTNHVYEIGYAVRFVEIGDTERLFLERLISQLKQTSHPSNEGKTEN